MPKEPSSLKNIVDYEIEAQYADGGGDYCGSRSVDESEIEIQIKQKLYLKEKNNNE